MDGDTAFDFIILTLLCVVIYRAGYRNGRIDLLREQLSEYTNDPTST